MQAGLRAEDRMRGGCCKAFSGGSGRQEKHCHGGGKSLKHEAMRTILLVILILLLIGALPAWPYSTGWGYFPSVGLILLIVLVLFLVKA